MKHTDNRFWDSCGETVNKLFLWLFIAFAALLAINLWCLLITAIACLIEGGIKLLTLLKIFGALGIVLVLFSNVALWQVMYSPKHHF